MTRQDLVVLSRCDVGRIEIPASDVLQHYLRLESGPGGTRRDVPSNIRILGRKSRVGVLSIRQHRGFEAVRTVAVVGLVDRRRGREDLRRRQSNARDRALIRSLRFLDLRVFAPVGIRPVRGRDVRRHRRQGALVGSVLLFTRGVVPDFGQLRYRDWQHV